MSQEPLTQTKDVVATKAAPKRYAAPRLEAYGTLQALTQTGAPPYYSGSDFSTYYTSTLS